MPTPFLSRIEPLEARIAPAAVFTYIDVDGDLVTIKTSKGNNNQLADIVVPFLSSEGVPNGQELQQIDFSMNAAVFKGTDLSVTAVRSNGAGDGRVNVGYIDATSPDDGASLDLGNVKISGDLGRIVAGDDTATTPGVKSLTVGSVGRYGTDTQAGGGNLNSTITGALPSLVVKGDFADGSLIVSNGMTPGAGKIGSIAIGGSLIGGATAVTGYISAAGGIAKVNIAHDLQGGIGSSSGQIFTGAKLGSVTIGGSLIGGAGFHSGRLQAGSIGTVLIKGSLVGGSQGSVMMDDATGSIESAGSIGSVTIGGSILGGNDPASATIRAVNGSITNLTVGGDIIGRGARSAAVTALILLQNVTVHGSIVGGFQAPDSAEIRGGTIGKIVIGGDLQGGVNSPQSGYIDGVNSITSITIGGSVIGGIATNLADGGNAGQGSGAIYGFNIGSVLVKGDLVGKSGRSSGTIFASNRLDQVSIGGSVIGGDGEVTGGIQTAGSIGSVKIGGDLRGGETQGFNINRSGFITSLGAIGNITIGGSVVAGAAVGGNSVQSSGIIAVGDDLGSLVVKGSLVGNSTNYVSIVARGKGGAFTGPDLAIKSITIGGRVENTNILAGYSESARGLNADAQIGSVSVGGDWIASSILAGINPFTDGKIGTADDRELLGGEDFGSGPVKDSNALTSKIASIVIKGGVFGTPGLTTDTFGFGAQEIVSFKIGSVTLPLKPGVANDVFATSKAQPIAAGRSSANTGDGFEIHVFEV